MPKKKVLKPAQVEARRVETEKALDFVNRRRDLSRTKRPLLARLLRQNEGTSGPIV